MRSPLPLAVLAALVGGVGASAQDDDAVTRATAAWTELRGRLRPAEGGVRLPMDRRATLLAEFLERHDSPPTRGTHALLDARAMLGSLLLTSFRPAGAAEQFARLQRDTAPQDIDRRARALYGLAQAAELRGRADDAGARYRELVTDYVGTRYADWARAALRRLSRTSAAAPRAGERATEFGPRLDVEGRAFRLVDFEGAATVVVFWSPDDPRGTERIDAVHRAVRDATVNGAAVRMLGFALAADDERTRTRLADLDWKFPQIACPSPFLDDVIFDYGVEGTPTWVLLDAKGRLVARDPPPIRLRDLLDRLGGG